MAKAKLNILEAMTPTTKPEPVNSYPDFKVKEETENTGFTAPALSGDARKTEAKQRLQKFMDEEMKLVKGIFQNFETPGMALRVQVRKYPGHFFDQTLEDGKVCEVPLYVARHLNGIDVTATAIGGKVGTCSYEVHKHIVDANGMPLICKEERRKRFGFQSMEFAGMVA